MKNSPSSNDSVCAVVESVNEICSPPVPVTEHLCARGSERASERTGEKREEKWPFQIMFDKIRVPCVPSLLKFMEVPMA